jgi:hypothetical protein
MLVLRELIVILAQFFLSGGQLFVRHIQLIMRLD